MEAERGWGDPGSGGSRAGLHLRPVFAALSNGGLPQGAASAAAAGRRRPFSGGGRQVLELRRGTLRCPAGWRGAREGVEQQSSCSRAEAGPRAEAQMCKQLLSLLSPRGPKGNACGLGRGSEMVPWSWGCARAGAVNGALHGDWLLSPSLLLAELLALHSPLFAPYTTHRPARVAIET